MGQRLPPVRVLHGLRVRKAGSFFRLFALVFHVASLAQAADLRVALVRAPRADTEASTTAGTYGRVRAELLAGGLSVVMLVEADVTSRASLESAAVRVRSIAAISVATTAADQPEAYVWLAPGPDREGALVQVQVGATGEEGDRLLALRVADLLFASLVELEPLRRKREGGDATEPEPPPKTEIPPAQEVQETEPLPKEPTANARVTDTSKPRRTQTAEVTLGGSAFVSFAGLPATFAPTVTAGWWPARRWRLGGIFSGPATGSIRVREVGNVDFDQELLAADVHFVAVDTERLSLHSIVGAGAFRMASAGQPEEQPANELPADVTLYYPGSDTTVRGLGLVGAGGRVVLAHPLWFMARVEAAFITDPPNVKAPHGVASVGIPLLLFSLAFGMGW